MRKILFIILAIIILFSSCQESIINNIYTVTFSYNDTKRPIHDTVKVNEGSLLERPEDPTREGYAFQGWYKAETDTEYWQMFDFSTPITESIMLYAKWEPAWKVTLQLEDVAPARTIMVEKAIGTLTIPDLTDVFVNSNQIEWYISGSDDKFDGTVTQDLTLYPRSTTGCILTADNTYLVYSLDGFRLWINAVTTDLSASCKLFTDIDFNANGSIMVWSVVGTRAPYTGTFDGQGHTISNLTFNTDGAMTGFFGRLAGTVKNVKLSAADIALTSYNGAVYFGSIAGYAEPGAVIENCEITNAKLKTVPMANPTNTLYLAAGGVVGFAEGARIEACLFRGDITATKNAHIGGIAGTIQDTDIIGCISTGTYSSTGDRMFSGGLVGNTADSDSSLIGCYSRAEAAYGLIGTLYDVAGLHLTSPTLKACYWKESIEDGYPGNIPGAGATPFKVGSFEQGYERHSAYETMNIALGEAGSNYKFYLSNWDDPDYPMYIGENT